MLLAFTIKLLHVIFYVNLFVLKIVGMFYAEVSNFPMHMRIILRNFNMKYTKIYEFFEIYYVGNYQIKLYFQVIYMIFRLIFVPFHLVIGCWSS
jgi:hypothetical protein